MLYSTYSFHLHDLDIYLPTAFVYKRAESLPLIPWRHMAAIFNMTSWVPRQLWLLVKGNHQYLGTGSKSCFLCVWYTAPENTNTNSLLVMLDWGHWGVWSFNYKKWHLQPGLQRWESVARLQVDWFIGLWVDTELEQLSNLIAVHSYGEWILCGKGKVNGRQESFNWGVSIRKKETNNKAFCLLVTICQMVWQLMNRQENCNWVVSIR